MSGHSKTEWEKWSTQSETASTFWCLSSRRLLGGVMSQHLGIPFTVRHWEQWDLSAICWAYTDDNCRAWRAQRHLQIERGLQKTCWARAETWSLWKLLPIAVKPLAVVANPGTAICTIYPQCLREADQPPCHILQGKGQWDDFGRWSLLPKLQLHLSLKYMEMKCLWTGFGFLKYKFQEKQI